jgi:hypothetical protein
MRVPEAPVCIHLSRKNPVFTSLHLKSPVHVVPPQESQEYNKGGEKMSQERTRQCQLSSFKASQKCRIFLSKSTECVLRTSDLCASLFVSTRAISAFAGQLIISYKSRTSGVIYVSETVTLSVIFLFQYNLKFSMRNSFSFLFIIS